MTAWALEVPKGFQLPKSICSYGWALLAPNRWERASTGPPDKDAAFKRPLQVAEGTTILVNISQPRADSLLVKVESDEICDSERSLLDKQICRMLRLNDKDLQAVDTFQSLHKEARLQNFGRLLRSPTIWEDLVKCILLCNCGTVSMNAALCQKFGHGAFPTPAQLAVVDPPALQSSCGVGYRAKNIVTLAQKVESGEICMEDLDQSDLTDEELLRRLKQMPGIGPFSAANMLQLLGRYERIACDSETVRHLQAHHKTHQCTAANCEAVAAEVYGGFAPYQFLAYWFELWHSYETLLGPFADLDPSLYKSFTGHNMRRGALSARADDKNKAPRKELKEGRRRKRKKEEIETYDTLEGALECREQQMVLPRRSLRNREVAL